MITLSVKTQIDSAKLAKAVENDTDFWLFAAQTWHRLYRPYVPWRTGTLHELVTITPGQITHNAPYAARCYNGNFNFRKDRHPLATSQWDKAAMLTQHPLLVKTMQNYVDSGRLKI